MGAWVNGWIDRVQVLLVSVNTNEGVRIHGPSNVSHAHPQN
jgi:hypothetical protein